MNNTAPEATLGNVWIRTVNGPVYPRLSVATGFEIRYALTPDLQEFLTVAM